MYKVLHIGDKDWKIEFGIEASLYDECTEKLIEFIQTIAGNGYQDELPENATGEQILDARKAFIKEKISGICNIPSISLSLFYAGLLEHHGEEGDGSIRSKKDAKQLIQKYFNEHAEDGTDNFYDLLQILMEQMGADGFFKRTGIERMFEEIVKAVQETETKKAKRTKAGGK